MFRASFMTCLVASLTVSSAWGAPKISTKDVLQEQDLRSQALQETQNLGAKGARASEAQVTGMLTLKDPRPEAIGRSWTYFGGLSVQNFQPEGTASNSTGSSFDLSANDSTVMPALELGVLSRAYEIGKGFTLSGGVRLRGSFASSTKPVVLESGYEIDDVRLNTSLLGGGLIFKLGSSFVPRWALTLSPQTGVASYTQASSNDFAEFSRSFSYDSIGYGIDFSVTSTWSLFTEWTQRTARNPGSVALQSDNFELGAKVQW